MKFDLSSSSLASAGKCTLLIFLLVVVPLLAFAAPTQTAKIDRSKPAGPPPTVICSDCDPEDPPPPTNASPTVVITAPSNGASQAAPGSFTVQATASDSD